MAGNMTALATAWIIPVVGFPARAGRSCVAADAANPRLCPKWGLTLSSMRINKGNSALLERVSPLFGQSLIHLIQIPSAPAVMAKRQKKDSDAVIYVVDDDESFRNSLTWLIESMGFDVRAFASAREFLNEYTGESPGCLVLDVRMREMNGVELLELMPQNNIQIPTIIVSAFGDVPTAVRAMKAGAIEFLEKPFSDQALLDQIQRAVESDWDQREKNQILDNVRQCVDTLTKRELEILVLIGAGMSAPDIAEKLNVSVRTVGVHRANILKKMKATGTADLIRMYLSIQSD